MNRREFAAASLATAGIGGQVAVGEIEKPKPDEVILLTYPNGNMAVRDMTLREASHLAESLGCEIIVMPDVMRMSRISQADADRIIQHITKISKASNL